jgi:DNA modification methylase
VKSATGVISLLSADSVSSLRSAVLDTSYVSLGSRRTASPHEFYRYPARFSPSFARAAIEAFTDRCDFVLDPFVGGGTTLVEARLAGRRALGSDLNPLAVLVSRVKSRPHSVSELDAVILWAERLPNVFSTRGRLSHDEWTHTAYFRNIDSAEMSGVRTALVRARRSLESIDSPSAKTFARCVLMRAGQWALDMREGTPARQEFCERLIEMSSAMVDTAHEYRRSVRSADALSDTQGLRRTKVLNQALPGLAHRIGPDAPSPKLILTSPPYPGVYVNYHRWKVLGRKETPAPFWIANELDGNGMSHYTMSARVDETRNSYFARLVPAFADLCQIADQNTFLVQMVGFHDPVNDLLRYLDAMDNAGFEEFLVPELGAGEDDSRLWRDVPNRRWWVQDGTKGIHTAKEVVLLHKKKTPNQL